MYSLITLFVLHSLFGIGGFEKQVLRDHFLASYHSKDDAILFENYIDRHYDEAHPLLLGYKGVSLIMRSKYGSNPFKKLKRFNKGKRLLNESLALAPNSVELRYLRYSIQNNVPKFLNYYKHKQEDKSYILKHLNEEQDLLLYDMIYSYLEDCECLNVTEKEHLLMIKK